jgi:class 3 adenylate cyclase/adenylylsulfate kinase-like enzyme
MFCDLVDSTALSERLDLEKYREVLGAYHDASRRAIESYEGYIARYMGDGLLVYFGYPTAHEDDAERAIRAGLAVVESVGALTVPDVTLQVRVGIATGRVLAGDIVGEGASEERSVLGETPNLAARLQGLAAPDGVAIAASTMRLVEGRFELEALAPQQVKGLREPVQAFQAKAIRTTSRFEAATSRGLSAFVGRQGELQLLLERWAQARNGEGQVVMLSGEAGIGKSRMLRQLREALSEKTPTVLRYQCSPYCAKTAFMPFIEQLQYGAGFSPEDTAEEKLDKLERLLSPNVDEVSAAAPLAAALLSLPADRYPPLSMTPQRQKLETIAALVAQLEGLAHRNPMLVMAEDLHWIDPSTLEVFDAVVERAQTLPLLVVMTHRPEFDHAWEAFGHVTHHSLNRLNRSDGKALITQVAGGKALPETVLEQILQHTDGVPLFIEELTKTVLEGDLLREEDDRYVLDGALAPLAIPSTLQDSLMARLDRLAPVKEVAQTAACIGREFTTSLLARVSRHRDGSPLRRSRLLEHENRDRP